MKNTYIIDGIRTPIGNYQGALSTIRPDDLAAHVIKTVVARNPNIPKDAYADVIMGCANQAGEDNRISCFITNNRSVIWVFVSRNNRVR